jgi:hypothetical protein
MDIPSTLYDVELITHALAWRFIKFDGKFPRHPAEEHQTEVETDSIKMLVMIECPDPAERISLFRVDN